MVVVLAMIIRTNNVCDLKKLVLDICSPKCTEGGGGNGLGISPKFYQFFLTPSLNTLKKNCNAVLVCPKLIWSYLD